MKLISMTDAVLQSNQGLLDVDIVKYATFLKQPLKLEMFVPCDDEGNVLEYPSKICEEYGVSSGSHVIPLNGKHITVSYYERLYKYAKEKVLFEGLEISHLNERISFFKRGHCVLTYSFIKEDFIGNKDVERLVGWDLTLTPSAIKQIGL